MNENHIRISGWTGTLVTDERELPDNIQRAIATHNNAFEKAIDYGWKLAKNANGRIYLVNPDIGGIRKLKGNYKYILQSCIDDSKRAEDVRNAQLREKYCKLFSSAINTMPDCNKDELVKYINDVIAKKFPSQYPQCKQVRLRTNANFEAKLYVVFDGTEIECKIQYENYYNLRNNFPDVERIQKDIKNIVKPSLLKVLKNSAKIQMSNTTTAKQIKAACQKVLKSKPFVSVSVRDSVNLAEVIIYKRTQKTELPEQLNIQSSGKWIRIQNFDDVQFSLINDKLGREEKAMGWKATLGMYPQTDAEMKKLATTVAKSLITTLKEKKAKFFHPTKIEIRYEDSKHISYKIDNASDKVVVGATKIKTSDMTFYEGVAQYFSDNCIELVKAETFSNHIDLSPYLIIVQVRTYLYKKQDVATFKPNEVQYKLLQHIFESENGSKTALLSHLPESLTEKYSKNILEEEFNKVTNTMVDLPGLGRFPLIYNYKVSGYYDSYSIYGTDRQFENCFLSDENCPKPTIEDFAIMKPKGRELFWNDYIAAAKTKEEKWNLIQQLLTFPEDAQAKFFKSKQGKAFVASIEDKDDRAFAEAIKANALA